MQLPETGFIGVDGNTIEKIFYGRLPVQKAGSAFYFTKDSLVQKLAVELKYKGNKAMGQYLGRLLGKRLQSCRRFEEVDVIVPLPLNPKKQRKRGYNQAEEIAKGIAEVWSRPVISNAVIRNIFTDTQTHKTRVSRWQTMEAVFSVSQPLLIEGKHVLLVDDIITTGATLEACGQAMLQTPGVKLSIATVAYTI
ncbi:ComF family protein [Foetidibacter luteolus]|uniref:ComF family protein n=1 Tax=Foetidibacter luteolus TaxID=2608880 RepID=UPI001F43F35E|nr:phosphoribosyltransferase family protein [Foetidibacter luteolus]